MNAAEAIRQFADEVRRVPSAPLVDIEAGHQRPTNEELAAHRAQVERLCDELIALADGSPTFEAFDEIRRRLLRIHGGPALATYLAVQDAFVLPKAP